MHYLGLALYAEGSTDYYFLRPLPQRLCEDICTREAGGPVDVSEVLALNHPVSTNDAPRDQRILAAAQTAAGAWRILFVHADGASDPARARMQQIQPAFELLQASYGSSGQGIAVVPVRETEAWAIADGDALRRVLGTQLSDGELGLPASSHAVEAEVDPKAVLHGAFNATTPTGRRRKQGIAPFLNAIGEQVALSALRRLKAFSELENDLKTALRNFRIL